MTASSTLGPTSGRDGVTLYFALACAITWTMASGAALAWMRHQSPSPLAVAGAGLSAFGPLLAALVVAGRQSQLRQLFGRWRTSPAWVLLALLAAPLVHLIATALFVAIGGHPDRWFHPPNTPEALAALVVFPLGEEFGWRGFAHPRMVSRYGLVRGALGVGVVWGLWHLMYTITPTAGRFDPVELALIMTELPLYALLIAWVFERANRSMAVAHRLPRRRSPRPHRAGAAHRLPVAPHSPGRARRGRRRGRLVLRAADGAPAGRRGCVAEACRDCAQPRGRAR